MRASIENAAAKPGTCDFDVGRGRPSGARMGCADFLRGTRGRIGGGASGRLKRRDADIEKQLGIKKFS
jgi:hypothetical protein